MQLQLARHSWMLALLPLLPSGGVTSRARLVRVSTALRMMMALAVLLTAVVLLLLVVLILPVLASLVLIL